LLAAIYSRPARISLNPDNRQPLLIAEQALLLSIRPESAIFVLGSQQRRRMIPGAVQYQPIIILLPVAG
jgi:hypothetical protein